MHVLIACVAFILRALGLRRYVGVDIARISLQDFVERLDERSQQKVERLFCADNSDDFSVGVFDTYITSERQWKKCAQPLTAADTFDVISCQFAMASLLLTLKVYS